MWLGGGDECIENFEGKTFRKMATPESKEELGREGNLKISSKVLNCEDESYMKLA
jgi:hypothetical protein